MKEAEKHGQVFKVQKPDRTLVGDGMTGFAGPDIKSLHGWQQWILLYRDLTLDELVIEALQDDLLYSLITESRFLNTSTAQLSVGTPKTFNLKEICTSISWPNQELTLGQIDFLEKLWGHFVDVYRSMVFVFDARGGAMLPISWNPAVDKPRLHFELLSPKHPDALLYVNEEIDKVVTDSGLDDCSNIPLCFAKPYHSLLNASQSNSNWFTIQICTQDIQILGKKSDGCVYQPCSTEDL